VGWLVGTVAAVDIKHPNVAMAVAPITQRETDTGMAKARRLLRQDPPKILRPKMNTEFAVLLMRTSYSIVDELDMVPMNQFQRDFFLIRTAEYEPYIQSLGPGYVQQGDLTDPSYFDFISFAQYLTINRVLSDPAVVFEELQPVLPTATTLEDRTESSQQQQQRFEPVIIRRTITNDQLIPTFQKKLGETVLRYLEDTYRNTPIAITLHNHNINNNSEDEDSNRRPSIDAIQAALTQLVKLFLINGFAWDGRVEVIPPANVTNTSKNDNATDVTFCIVLDAPASLWGNESLHRQRATLTNDYILNVAKEFLQQRTGYTVVASRVQFQNNSERSYLTIR
jgi:hypothetical protein